MQEFSKWLVENWQYVSSIGFSFLSFILLFIFRRTKIVDPSVYSDIISYVNEAEKIYGKGHGKEKYQLVINRLSHTRGLSPFFTSIAYGFFIENVLSTPHKKDGE